MDAALRNITAKGKRDLKQRYKTSGVVRQNEVNKIFFYRQFNFLRAAHVFWFWAVYFSSSPPRTVSFIFYVKTLLWTHLAQAQLGFSSDISIFPLLSCKEVGLNLLRKCAILDHCVCVSST
jgi:hypothetical protein